MGIYVAFGVNIGNLGREKSGRSSQLELVHIWNSQLSINECGIHFLDFFFSTGNYVLRSNNDQSLKEVSNLLVTLIPDRKFAAFDFTQFNKLLEPIRVALSQSPSPLPGKRWTPGLVMDTDPAGEVPPLPTSDDRVAFGAYGVPRIRIAWKADRLDLEGERLQRTHKAREGGWGTLSTRMRQFGGGTYTARSLKTIEGLMEVCNSHA